MAVILNGRALEPASFAADQRTCAVVFSPADKPLIITEPAVLTARLLDLGSKLYPSNMQRMLNKDLTRFTQSFSSTPKSSKRKKDSAVRSVLGALII